MNKFLLAISFIVIFATYAYFSVSTRAQVPVSPAASSPIAALPETPTPSAPSAPNPGTSEPPPTPNPTPAPTPTSTGTPKQIGLYRDGAYAGNIADAFYGPLQVEATIQGGRLVDVQFLQYPNDRRNSIEINRQAMPYLKEEAIQVQSANVDIVSGATQTSDAFRETLGTALAAAKNS